MPKISVISAVYCMERYLNQFLESIKQQTFQDYEVILVDDGSHDNSPAILDQYAQSEPRAIVIHKNNGGVSSARNAALDRAIGEYVYIVDSDDWLEPTALETLWSETERTGADVVFGAYITESDSSSTIRKPFSHAFTTTDKEVINEIQTAANYTIYIRTDCQLLKPKIRHGGAPWRGMFRRSVAEEHGVRYNEKLRTLGEDVLFWQELLEYVHVVSYTDSVIYHYRLSNSSLSNGYKPDIISVFRKAFEAEEEFLRKNHKGKEHWEAYYIRVIQYINRALASYYQNKENKKSESIRLKEFKQLLQSEPFRSALSSVPLSRFTSRKLKIKVLLLRCRLVRTFWMIDKHER